MLDLRPEGFQLLKLNEVIKQHFSEATQAHTLVHFWEYVLYLELAHKIIGDDERWQSRDPRLSAPFEELKTHYENVDELREGDFPERLLRLIQRLQQDVVKTFDQTGDKILTTPQLTELIYKTDFVKLRKLVLNYLKLKKSALILIDNLDRGWSAAGVSDEDVANVQCLLDAGRRIEREASKQDISLSAVIFLRDDVYDWLVKQASDRGKDSVVRINWSDPDQLLDLVERRLLASSKANNISPPVHWHQISSDGATERKIFDYLVKNCLRRPRSLIDLIELTLSNAVMMGRDELTLHDAEKAVSSYSIDMLSNLNFEVRDIFPNADRVIYEYAREGIRLDRRRAERMAKKELKNDSDATKFVDVMLWFGFFGILGVEGEENYIFDHGDNLDLLEAHAGRSENPILCIHPLFRGALSLRADLLL